MEMLSGDQITRGQLTDWRKLGQGLHARFRVGDFAAGVRFVSAIAEAGDVLGHHPRVTIGGDFVDLKLISDDAIFRDDEGTEHIVEWVTQRDVDLAGRSGRRRRTRRACRPGVDHGDRAGTRHRACGQDRADVGGRADRRKRRNPHGRGTIGDDVRDASGRVPILWFQDTDEHETPRQRFHVDVWVAPEVADERIAAAVAAGGTITDDSQAPSYTVIADQDGNKACVCTSLRPA